MIKIQNVLLLIILSIGIIFPNFSLASTKIYSDFNPNKLIEDKVFSDEKSMGSASAVQQFLEEKGSVLANTSDSFIQLLKEPTSTSLKTTLEDPEPNLEKTRTAAELIWDAAQSSGLNPQVILVTLQKEQSLITGRKSATAEQLQRALDISMGFGCPDSGGCAGLYVGFYHQLFGNVDAEGNRYLGATKSLMKSFSTPGGRGPFYNGSVAKIGDTIVLGNTLGGYEGVEAEQSVRLENAATAALYRYTPHVFNGNYNFFRYMKEWFGDGKSISKPTHGDLKDGSVFKYSKKYYYYENGKKYLITAFVEKARKLKTKSAKSLTRKEFNKIPDGGNLGLSDNTIVRTESGLYLFVGNKRFNATEALLTQRGLSVNKAIIAQESDLKDFGDPQLLPPAEGAVLKGDKNSQVYVVENAQLRLVSALVFEQRAFSGRVQTLPEAEIAKYPKGGYAAPNDGTVIKRADDPTVYIVLTRIKRPIPSSAVLKTYGHTFSDIKIISKEEMEALPTGAMAEPKDSTYYQIEGTGQLWVYRNNSRHYIAPFVAKQRSITPDVTLKASESNTWPEGDSIMPKDGTLIKSDKTPAVYIIDGGELLALSGSQFQARGLSFKDVQVLPDADVKKFLASNAAQ